VNESSRGSRDLSEPAPQTAGPVPGMLAAKVTTRSGGHNLGRYMLRRLMFLPVGIFIVITGAFALISLIPSNPAVAIAGNLATPGKLQAIDRRLGLNRTWPVQYVHYLNGIVHGSLGNSYYTGNSVLSDIGTYLPSTIELVVLSLVVTVILGVILGWLSANTEGRRGNIVLRIIVGLTQSIPDFLLGLTLILVLFSWLHVVGAPIGQTSPIGPSPRDITGAALFDSAITLNGPAFTAALDHAILPVLSLGIIGSAYFARATRSALVKAYRSREVEFARALSLPRRRIEFYALQQALPSLFTYGGLLCTAMIGGDAIVEQIFSWNGYGQFILGRITQIDLPEIEGFAVVTGTITLIVFLLVDVAIALVDPRATLTARRPFGRPAVPRPAPRAPRDPTLERALLAEWLGDDQTRQPDPQARREATARRGHQWKAYLVPGLAVLVLGGLILAGYFAPLPYRPNSVDVSAILAAPSRHHWFGTDSLGRDVFSRTIAAARIDLPLALGGVLASLLVGTGVGLLASTRSRWSEALMRCLDMFQAFPLLILAIIVVVLTGDHTGTLIIAIMLFVVPAFIRIVRNEALLIRERRFIEAAVASGCPPARITARHILPSLTGPILVQTSLAASTSILAVAGLSFLGIGIRPPTASWGAMLQNGYENIVTGQWWPVVFPGLAIVLVVWLLNTIADYLDAHFGRGARA
jgi:peptide/nickel transport system permease protein